MYIHIYIYIYIYIYIESTSSAMWRSAPSRRSDLACGIEDIVCVAYVACDVCVCV